jgi:hypothetical protein
MHASTAVNNDSAGIAQAYMNQALPKNNVRLTGGKFAVAGQ